MLLYPVVALSQLAGPASLIIPVTHLRKSDEATVKELLSPFGNVDTMHITSDADQGDVISLKYIDQNKWLERQTAFMNPIVPADVEDLHDRDAFVFVPVTDFEVGLETLIYLKGHSKGTIIFDAHGPTNTCTR